MPRRTLGATPHFGKHFIKRCQFSEAQLFERLGLLAVGHQLIGSVPGPLTNPVVGLAIGETSSREAMPEGMRTKR